MAFFELMLKLGSKKISIYDLSADIWTGCGYQILVIKICNGGRIFYILTKFFSNISTLNSKYFTY